MDFDTLKEQIETERNALVDAQMVERMDLNRKQNEAMRAFAKRSKARLDLFRVTDKAARAAEVVANRRAATIREHEEWVEEQRKVMADSHMPPDFVAENLAVFAKRLELKLAKIGGNHG